MTRRASPAPQTPRTSPAGQWSGWDELSPILRFANFYDAKPDGDFGPRYVREFQILFVQSGRGTARVEDQTFAIESGDIIFYGPLECHTVITDRQDPLKLVGVVFLFRQQDESRLDPRVPHAQGMSAYQHSPPPICPLDPRPPTKVSSGVMSAARQWCESLVLSYTAAPKGRPMEKRGLLLMLFESWREAIEREQKISALTAPQRRAMDDAQRALLTNLVDPPDVESLAETSRMSGDHFSRLFRRHTGTTVADFVVRQRLLVARRLLVEGRLAVKEVAHAVGFNDPFYFSRRFTRQFGVTPSGFRNAGGSI